MLEDVLRIAHASTRQVTTVDKTREHEPEELDPYAKGKALPFKSR